jgi:hypothetical protein
MTVDEFIETWGEYLDGSDREDMRTDLRDIEDAAYLLGIQNGAER